MVNENKINTKILYEAELNLKFIFKIQGHKNKQKEAKFHLNIQLKIFKMARV